MKREWWYPSLILDFWHYLAMWVYLFRRQFFQKVNSHWAIMWVSVNFNCPTSVIFDNSTRLPLGELPSPQALSLGTGGAHPSAEGWQLASWPSGWLAQSPWPGLCPRQPGWVFCPPSVVFLGGWGPVAAEVFMWRKSAWEWSHIKGKKSYQIWREP